MKPSDHKYPLRWVAYFDLLGFRGIVKRNSLWDVLEHYQKALDEIKKLGKWTPAKWFSDTFLFYTDDDSRDSFDRISGASEIFFRSMLRGRIPVRGCLTFGEFYAGEGESLFGPALLEAYEEAEAQDWLGLILTRRAEDRMKCYPVNGRTAYEVLLEYSVTYYEVPFKKRKSDLRTQSGLVDGCRRLVYTANCGASYRDERNREWIRLLLNDLGAMQCLAGEAAESLLEKESIERKYENTKAFLLNTASKATLHLCTRIGHHGSVSA